MKNIVKFIFAVLLVSGMATSCTPDDNHSMSGDMVTDSMLSFTMTPGADEFTFSFTADITNPNLIGMWNVVINFDDLSETTVAGRTLTPLTVAHRFEAFAGVPTTVTASFRTPNGVFTRTQTVTLQNDNAEENPESLQYLLTGGWENTAGRTWQLGPWTSMRDPNNLGTVWWNFFTAEDGIAGDSRFVFTPNSIRPRGGFTHIPSARGAFINENTHAAFPDGNSEGSFITQYYTPPANATWVIISNSAGEPTHLEVQGFLGYATQPSDLTLTRYSILEWSPERIRLRGSGNWFFELVPTVD